MGVEQRSFTDEEILRRLLFASVNEACKILEEGKAYRASLHRCDVAGRLRLPALPRRADVMGRRHRHGRGLPPDPGLAPAIRRALGSRRAAPPPRRNRHPAARSQAGPPNVSGDPEIHPADCDR